MEDLCYLLKDVNGAGEYRLNCSLDALHDSVQRAGFVLFEADIATAHGKGEVLAELARAIKAPDWFGHNWDALADALSDLSWRKAPGYVLLLRGEHPGDDVLDDILNATVEFWRMQRKPFWVFFA
ncbi:MAG: barstar family protein [Sideroxyarcus sp.]|nr:barstar family protein [Sideroxyarcus sp.]